MITLVLIIKLMGFQGLRSDPRCLLFCGISLQTVQLPKYKFLQRHMKDKNKQTNKQLKTKQNSPASLCSLRKRLLVFPLYVEHLLRYFYFGRVKEYSAV